MHKLVDIIRRMRHRRGFGVHSPLAFKLVNEVVRHNHGYAYYGYHHLNDPASMRLLRLVAVLHPAKITLVNSTPELIQAVKQAGNIEKPNGIHLFIDTSTDSDIKTLTTLLTAEPERGIYCRWLSDSELTEIKSCLTEGIILSARRYTILLHRAGMPLQHYPV